LKEQLNLLWELQKIDLELRNIKIPRGYPKEIERLTRRRRAKGKIRKDKEKIE